MAQILVLDTDPTLKLMLDRIFAADEKFRLLYVSTLPVALEILNGNPAKKTAAAVAKQELDSAVAQVQSVAARVLENKEKMEFALREGLKLEKQIQAASAEAAATPAVVEAKAEWTKYQTDANQAKAAMTEAVQAEAKAQKQADDKRARSEELVKSVPAGADEVIGLCLIADSYLQPNPVEWLSGFKKSITYEPNCKVSVALTGNKATDQLIRKYLIPGIFDYFVKPLDELLAKQNLKFLASEKKELEREVYALAIKSQVDLIYEYEIEAISEQSFTVRSTVPFEKDQFRMFSSELFLRKLERKILARCLQCNKISETEEQYLSEFWFVGVEPFFLHQIRTVIEKSTSKAKK